MIKCFCSSWRKSWWSAYGSGCFFPVLFQESSGWNSITSQNRVPGRSRLAVCFLRKVQDDCFSQAVCFSDDCAPWRAPHLFFVLRYNSVFGGVGLSELFSQGCALLMGLQTPSRVLWETCCAWSPLNFEGFVGQAIFLNELWSHVMQRPEQPSPGTAPTSLECFIELEFRDTGSMGGYLGFPSDCVW